MSLAKIGLRVAAVALIVIGVGFLVVPVGWASIVEIVLPTAMARTDLRATYGGFDLGIGVFLWLCALRPEWTKPGVVALALGATGYGGGRLLGIFVEREAHPLMVLFVVIETATALFALYALRRLPPVHAPSDPGLPQSAA
jgi:Domain of unknown function (DUF4345)